MHNRALTAVRAACAETVVPGAVYSSSSPLSSETIIVGFVAHRPANFDPDSSRATCRAMIEQNIKNSSDCQRSRAREAHSLTRTPFHVFLRSLLLHVITSVPAPAPPFIRSRRPALSAVCRYDLRRRAAPSVDAPSPLASIFIFIFVRLGTQRHHPMHAADASQGPSRVRAEVAVLLRRR